ncbi:MAG TPA: 3-hydroxylacyl-ACP dehydratase [Gammaproteobacteria bacterium]|nr:3-hydroxylacyl-ACP dehydratase [Gammaproteobacteria bacterium]
MTEAFPHPSELLPHAGRAVLIDEIVADSTDAIDVIARITATHPYYVHGRGVPSWVGIELMAQAIAAHAGLTGRRERRPPRMGMLLGTRRYAATAAWFAEGARLEIHAERAFGNEGGMAACDCRIRCGGETLAEATIIIAEMAPDAALSE